MSGRSSVKHSMQGVALNHLSNNSHNKLGRSTQQNSQRTARVESDKENHAMLSNKGTEN